MDAGVPIKAPVAGIAMGLIKEGDNVRHPHRHPRRRGSPRRHGLQGLRHQARHHRHPDGHQDRTASSREILQQALEQAREGRLHILGKMVETLAAPRDRALEVRAAHHHAQGQARPDPHHHRPRRQDHQGHRRPDRRRDRRRGRRHGQHRVARSDAGKKALDIIKGLTPSPRSAQIYKGTVKRITDFGAFVEILPGTDGLLHISEMAHKRVERSTDVLKEGDEVR